MEEKDKKWGSVSVPVPVVHRGNAGDVGLTEVARTLCAVIERDSRILSALLLIQKKPQSFIA